MVKHGLGHATTQQFATLDETIKYGDRMATIYTALYPHQTCRSWRVMKPSVFCQQKDPHRVNLLANNKVTNKGIEIVKGSLQVCRHDGRAVGFAQEGQQTTAPRGQTSWSTSFLTPKQTSSHPIWQGSTNTTSRKTSLHTPFWQTCEDTPAPCTPPGDSSSTSCALAQTRNQLCKFITKQEDDPNQARPRLLLRTSTLKIAWRGSLPKADTRRLCQKVWVMQC